ncbi:MAG: alpha/beta hydrolase [Syntrophotaleaceae bacterium]
MLNGIGLDLSAWAPVVQALGDERRLVLLDTRGSGRSAPAPQPCTTARLAADALALLDHLSLDSVEVLGFSLGGLRAQELALLAPQRIRALVLAATAARLPGRTRRVLDARGSSFWPGQMPTPSAASSSARIFGPATLDNDALIEKALAALADTPAPQRPAFRAQVDACSGPRRPDRVSRIAAPALVLAGADDILLPFSRDRDPRRAAASRALRAPPRRPRLPVREHPRRCGVGAAISGLGKLNLYQGNWRMLSRGVRLVAYGYWRAEDKMKGNHRRSGVAARLPPGKAQ